MRRSRLQALLLVGVAVSMGATASDPPSGSSPDVSDPRGVWRPLAPSNLPVHSGTGVWTGTQLLVWDGVAGGAYDPTTDTWQPISNISGPPSRQPAVWTGTEMIIWQGGPSVGAAYNPTTDTWRALARPGAPRDRILETVVWTGSEVLVWGGCCTPLGALGDGGRYEPIADAWHPISPVGAPGPRSRHVAVWTGHEMLVWGGSGLRGEPFLCDGGRYDPATDTWAPLPSSSMACGQDLSAAWTGTKMIVWGREPGCPDPLPCRRGARYDPSGNVWEPISYSGAPSGRYNAAFVYDGHEVLLSGGGDGNRAIPGGGRYDPRLDIWSAMSDDSAPVPHLGPLAVWTGAELLVSGGSYDCPDPSGFCDAADGGRYVPPFADLVSTASPERDGTP